MRPEILIIVSLCLIIISISLFMVFQRNKLIRTSINDLEIMHDNLVRNYEIHVKYLEEIVQKLHSLNYQINVISKKEQDTDIKFTTITTSKFEDSQKIDIKGINKL